MDEMIEKIYKQLEAEDTLWKELEQSLDYAAVHHELTEVNQQIKLILEEKLGREGRTLLNDQEALYYKLLSISQKYFFMQGFNLQKNMNK